MDPIADEASAAPNGAADKFEGSPPIVSMRGVVSLIGRFPALAGADLTIRAGEVVLLTGPNGAGKSTVLRVLAGLAPVTRGKAEVLGLDASDRSQRREIRRRVGLLAHTNALYSELTVEENLRFWTRANGSDPAGVAPAMDRLGLSGRLAGVAVSGLSAGQRRRTAMAVLICRRPSLWLLDEPHAGLDSDGRDLVDELVHQAVDSGATAVIASHELERNASLATRTVTVSGGQIR